MSEMTKLNNDYIIQLRKKILIDIYLIKNI